MARGTWFASCRLRTQSRQRLAACKDETSRPPARPLCHSQDPVPVCFTLTRVAGSESFVSVEVAGSNGPRQIEDAPPRTRTARPAPGFPRGVQAGSHRLAQVFHGVLLAPASSVGDDFPGRRRATARRLPERPHACRGHGEDGRVSPRSRTVLAGSPRHGALQCAAKRSTRLSGRRSRRMVSNRMVSNDEHEMRGRGLPAPLFSTPRAPAILGFATG